MDKLFKFVKSHKKVVSVIIFAMFIVPIVMVHFLFKWRSDCEFLQAEWSAGDVLVYTGGFYAFLGTVVFSMLALWQNHIIAKKNDEHNRELQSVEVKLNAPILDIPFTGGLGQGSDGNCSNLSFHLRNLTFNPAINLKISNFAILNNEKQKVVSLESVKLNDSAILGNSSIGVKFLNGPVKGKNLTVVFDIEYKDRYYNKHKIKATGKIEDSSDFHPIEYDLKEQEDTANGKT